MTALYFILALLSVGCFVAGLLALGKSRMDIDRWICAGLALFVLIWVFTYGDALFTK